MPGDASRSDRGQLGNLRRFHVTIEELQEDNGSVVEQAIDKYGLDINTKYKGRTALHVAAKRCLQSVSETLIGRGAAIDARDDTDGATPLMVACQQGHTKVVALLLHHGADPGVPADDGSHVLEIAIRSGSIEMAELLVCGGSAPSAVSHTGQTALHICAEVGSRVIAELLLKHKCDVNKEDDCRKTALAIAAGSGHCDIVHLLIGNGSSLNTQDSQRCTALTNAVQGGHYECVKKLIDAGADPKITNAKKLTPLMHALLELNLPIMRLLINADGSLVDAADWQGTTPLIAAVRHAAARQQCDLKVEAADTLMTLATQPGNSEAKEAVCLLIDSGCNLDKREELNGQTALIISCLAGSSDVTKLLLARGADVGAADKFGNTPLHAAVNAGCTRTIEMLLHAEGCNVNAVNSNGETALNKAARVPANAKIIQMLLDAGADTNSQDSVKRRTPLYEAIENGCTDAALLLLNAGCSCNILDANGLSPLYVACNKGDESAMARLLARKDCDVNLGSELPLHTAIRKGNLHWANALICRKADVNLVNSSGQTPLFVAVEAYDARAIDMLLLGGAAVDVQNSASTLQQRGCCRVHNDAHPHVVLQPLFEALHFQDVRLFEHLLEYHYRTPYKLLRTLHDMITINHVDGRSLVTGVARSGLLRVMRAALDSVRSLKHLCRGVVRERLGADPPSKVGRIGLPSDLQKLLLHANDDDRSKRGSP